MSLRQGTLSFASAKRSGAKDSLKGKTAATSIEHPVVPIRIGGKRKYEPDPEPEQEEAKGPTEVLERERLDTEDPRWNKAFGQARSKMGNIKPGPSFAPRSLFVLADSDSWLQSMRRINLPYTTSCASSTCE